MAQMQSGVPYTSAEQDSVTTIVEALNILAEDQASFDGLADLPLDTDITLASNSDTKIATQKATKTYVDSTGSPSVANISTSTTLAPTTLNFTALVTTSTTDKTITLPAATDVRQIVVKKVDAGTGYVVVTAAGSDTIDGSTTYTITSQWESVTVICNGTNGWIIK